MANIRTVFLIFFCLFLASSSALAQTSGGNFVPGEIIIKFKDQATKSEKDALLSEMGAHNIATFHHIGATCEKLEALKVDDVIARFSNHPSIQYIEPNSLMHGAIIPDDPLFPEQHALLNTGQYGGLPGADIRATWAWNYSTGSDGIVVAILDTGIDLEHPELVDNLWTNTGEIPGNGLDDDENGYVDDVHGYDFHNGDSDPSDDAGHGTHIAGIIGARGNNSNGVAGVCWNVTIMPIKYLSEGLSGTTSEAISSIEYAIDNGAHVLNLSWIGTQYEQSVFDVILAAEHAGILVVAAAGNFGSDNDYLPHFPASYDIDNIISVAATERDDQLANTSNYGLTSVDLAAPGAYIHSTLPGGTYGNNSGTSMAAPFVTGALAMLMDAFPDLTPQEYKTRLLDGVHPLPGLEGLMVTGGRLDLLGAMTGIDLIPPGNVSDLSVASIASNWVGLEWTAPGDNGATGLAHEYEIRYATFPLDEENFHTGNLAPDAPTPSAPNSLESYQLLGLDPLDTYFIALRTSDIFHNTSLVSNLVTATTLTSPEVNFYPDEIDAEVSAGGTISRTMTLENTGNGVLDFQITGSDMAWPEWLSVSPLSGNLLAGQNLDISISFDATGMCSGQWEYHLEITHNDPSSNPIDVPLNLNVIGESEITIAPMVLDFGGIVVGNSRELFLEITNTGCDLLSVSQVSVDHPDFLVSETSFTLTSGASASLPVEFSPSAVETANGIILFSSDDPSQPEVAVTVTGVGLQPPVIEISPQAVSLQYSSGQTGTEILALTNTGGSELHFTSQLIRTSEPGISQIQNFEHVLLLENGVGAQAQPFFSNALENLGLEFELTRYPSTLHSSLIDGTPWDLVLINASGTFSGDDLLDDLAQYVENGGNLLFSHWGLSSYADHPFLQSLGIEFQENTTMPQAFSTNDPANIISTFPNNIRTLVGNEDYLLIDGQLVTPLPGAIGLATYDNNSSYQAIIHNLQRSTIFNAFQAANYTEDRDNDGKIDMVELIENEIAFLSQKIAWTTLTPGIGFLPAGQTQNLELSFDATGYCSIVHSCTLEITDVSGIIGVTSVPVELEIVANPHISVTPMALNFGEAGVGQSVSDTLVITNTECDILTGSLTTDQPDEFSFSPEEFNIPAGDSLSVVLHFSPNGLHNSVGSITIASNTAGQNPLLVSVQGVGVLAPEIIVETVDLMGGLFPGETRVQSITLGNSGELDLHWSAITGLDLAKTIPENKGASFAPAALDSLLDRLNRRYTNITDRIPFGVDFSGGETGWYISSDDSEMYTSGNRLDINDGLPIFYSEGEILPSEQFGDGGRYFTQKYPGLFVFGCEMDGLDWFRISGGLANNGAANVDGSALEIDWNGSRYQGFVKRIFNTTAPSVNHLIIIPEDDSATHSYSPLVVRDEHTVNFSGDTHQLYYLLFAGDSGAYIDDAAMLEIMEAFLESSVPSPAWLSVTPHEGVIQSGGTTDIVVTKKAGLVCSADIAGHLLIQSNSVQNPRVVIPALLQFEGGPNPEISHTVLDFGEVLIGSNPRQSFSIGNTGCGDLDLAEIYSSHPAFSLAEQSLVISPNETHEFDVKFTPQATGNFEAVLFLLTDSPGVSDIVIELHGFAVESPTISVSPDSVGLSNIQGEPFSVDLTIENTGGSDLLWSLYPDFFADKSQDLTGIKILIQQGEWVPHSSNYLTLVDHLTNRGAEVSYNFVNQLNGTLGDCDIYWTTTMYFLAVAEQFYSELTPWVLEGGSLVVFPDYDERDSVNSFLANIGADFHFLVSQNNPNLAGTIYPHAITRNVETLDWAGGVSPLVDSGPNATSLVGFDNFSSAVCSHVGQGRILGLGQDFLRNSVVAQPENFLFAKQAMDWLCGAFWFDANPVAGSIAPGGSASVECTINPLGQCTDVLSADLHILCNDVQTPEIVIPFHLELDAVPTLLAPGQTLSFDTIAVGFTDTLFVSLANAGCAPLTISSLVFDLADFSAPTGPFTIQPEESFTIPVIFTPSNYYPQLATLCVFSNDPMNPEKTLVFEGSGQHPPVATLGADSLVVALPPNSFSYFDQTFANDGDEPLAWTSSATSNELFPALDGVNRTLILESGISAPENMIYARAMEVLDLPYTLVTTWLELEDELETGGPWGLLMVNSYTGSATTNALDLVLDHIRMGRRLIYADANLGDYSDHPLLLELGVEYLAEATEPASFNGVIYTDPLFQTPNLVYYVTPSHDQGLVDRPIVQALPGFIVRARNYQGDSAPAVISSPSGKVIFNAFMSENYLGTPNYFAYVITSFIHNEIHNISEQKWFLWYYPRSGTIGAHQEVTIEMYVETYPLAQGSFRPSVTIQSNDPMNPEFSFPVRIDISEELIYQAPTMSSSAGWQMVGVPLRPLEGIENLGHLFLDSAPSGSALFRYGNSGQYIQVGAEDPIIHGQGLWLATPEPFTWNMSGHPDVDGVNLALYRGWNLVGYPLWMPGDTGGLMVQHQGHFRSFQSAASEGLISRTYFGLDQNSSAYVLEPELEPGRSYWIACMADSIGLFFDPSSMAPSSGLAKARPEQNEPQQDEAWTLDLTATGTAGGQGNQTAHLGSLRIGRHPMGTAGFDAALDMMAPPALPGSSPTTGLRMLRPQWEQPTGNAAWADIRSLEPGPESWECLVEAASSGSVTLRWDADQLPVSGDLRLYRRGMGEFLVESMREANSITLDSFGSAIYLEICTTDFTPPDMWLHADLDLRNAPNPFNPSTEIRFNLPREGRVQVRIYDVRGAQVMEISGGRMSPGPGFLAWTGQNSTGASSASGVYFYQLFLDDKRLGSTGKMMLLK